MLRASATFVWEGVQAIYIESHSLVALLSFAFGLGMLHALDADHIMAVSSLSGRQGNSASVLRFCLRWAVGHGSVLLLIGAAVLLLGMAIPKEVSHIAELMVGIVLVVIGLAVLFDILRKKAHLHFHEHDDLPQHAHWHRHQQKENHDKSAHRHQHQAVLIGILHGTAGSAPLLALLPMAQLSSPVWGLAYLLLFSLGVLFSMLLFGGLLGGVFQWVQRHGETAIFRLRLCIGCSAIVFGSAWLYGGL